VQEEGVIEREDLLQEYITNYYKALFGKSDSNNFSLDESMSEDITQITTELVSPSHEASESLGKSFRPI
jgi:hypothetical protein